MWACMNGVLRIVSWPDRHQTAWVQSLAWGPKLCFLWGETQRTCLPFHPQLPACILYGLTPLHKCQSKSPKPQKVSSLGCYYWMSEAGPQVWERGDRLVIALPSLKCFYNRLMRMMVWIQFSCPNNSCKLFFFFSLSLEVTLNPSASN